MEILLTMFMIFGLTLILDAITINVIYKLGSECEKTKAEIKSNSKISLYIGFIMIGSCVIISMLTNISIIIFMLAYGTIFLWLINLMLYIKIFKR